SSPFDVAGTRTVHVDHHAFQRAGFGGSRLEGFSGVGEVVARERLYAARQMDSGKENSCLREPH
ncbi:MAG: hypothetical protein LWX52_03025, partial [Deltaproteobacteria bacterium]|nr:hypothetical protein [Deltaproteobacteria bacterium]